ncbi:MAG TPA: aminoacyl-tRNA hydrolase [Clostridiaceae bacterium]|nr:aminoacyl-tRNA hydrolase [Clostridiaceae bacterium]
MTWLQKLIGKAEARVSSERWLIVGLGNPGEKYEKSWHNLGYMAIDKIAAKNQIQMKRLRFQGRTGEGNIGDTRVVLLKPLTYMNHSGRSVVEACNFYKIPPDRVVVLVDDIDLHMGIIRLRGQGSAGSHKGLKSIISHLDSQQFKRVRIGMGPRPEGDLADIVLARIPAQHKKLVENSLEETAAAVELLLSQGLAYAQSVYN